MGRSEEDRSWVCEVKEELVLKCGEGSLQRHHFGGDEHLVRNLDHPVDTAHTFRPPTSFDYEDSTAIAPFSMSLLKEKLAKAGRRPLSPSLTLLFFLRQQSHFQESRCLFKFPEAGRFGDAMVTWLPTTSRHESRSTGGMQNFRRGYGGYSPIVVALWLHLVRILRFAQPSWAQQSLNSLRVCILRPIRAFIYKSQGGSISAMRCH